MCPHFQSEVRRRPFPQRGRSPSGGNGPAAGFSCPRHRQSGPVTSLSPSERPPEGTIRDGFRHGGRAFRNASSGVRQPSGFPGRVRPVLDRLHLCAGDLAEVRPFRKMLTHDTVCVLVQAALVGRVAGIERTVKGRSRVSYRSRASFSGALSLAASGRANRSRAIWRPSSRARRITASSIRASGPPLSLAAGPCSGARSRPFPSLHRLRLPGFGDPGREI